jgi:hypothetical protein
MKDNHFIDFDTFEEQFVNDNNVKLLSLFNGFKIKVKNGIDTRIITARGNSNLIKNFLLKHNVNYPLENIYATGSVEYHKYGWTSERKEAAFKHLISKGYNNFIFYDDNKENLRVAKELEIEYPILMTTVHIKE